MLLHAENSLLLVIDVQEKLVPVIHGQERVIENCGWLMDVAREFDIPTLVTEQYPEGLGPTIDEIKKRSTVGSIFKKNHFSTVSEPGFLERPEVASRRQIVVCGMESHVCVLQTCLELVEHNFNVYLVEDATSSRTKDDRFIAIERMRASGVRVVSKEMVFFEWQRRGGGDIFRERIGRYF